MNYKFNGNLIDDQNNKIPAIVNLKQKQNGAIFIDCVFDNNVSIYERNITSIVGSYEGFEVIIDQIILKDHTINSSGNNTSTYMSKIANFKKVPTEDSEFVYRFNIVNFKFIGNTYYRNNEHAPNNQLKLNVNDSKIIIRPVKDYKSIVKELKYTRGINITAEIIINGGLSDKSRILEIIDNICILFSFAKGTKVNWISYSIENGNAEIIELNYHNRITKPFSGLRIISYENPDAIKNFVEQTYIYFINKKKAWCIDIIIEEFIDAIQEGDYLEFRALKLAVTLEYILGQSRQNGNKEFVLPEDQFTCKNGIEGKIKNAIKCKLSDTIKNEVLDAFNKNLKGLNRVTFTDSVVYLCQMLNLIADKKQIKRFKDLRNNLVHRAVFQNDNNQNNHWQDFKFIMSFITQVILGLLEYTGKYIDWNSVNNSNEAEMLREVQYENQTEE